MDTIASQIEKLVAKAATADKSEDAMRYAQAALNVANAAATAVELPKPDLTALVRHMVDRFLGWRLPADFNPDAGISFKPTFNDHLPKPMKHEPTGTNLFSATQAEAMVRHMLEGLPAEGHV